MNNEIEKLNKTQFQFFPLKNSFNFNYFTVDTKLIVELCGDGNKQNYLNNIMLKQDEIWGLMFNMKHPIFKNKVKNTYKFNYMIQTDCTGVSVLFTEKSKQVSNTTKKINKRTAKQKSKLSKKDKTIEEIEIMI